MTTPITSTQQRPWAARLAEASAGKKAGSIPLEAFLREPFPSTLLGASVYTGQPGLLSNTQILLNEILNGDEDKLRSSCWTLLNKLRDGIRSNDIESYTMLFRLLVEPFALMEQCTDLPKPSPSPSTTDRI